MRKIQGILGDHEKIGETSVIMRKTQGIIGDHEKYSGNSR